MYVICDIFTCWPKGSGWGIRLHVWGTPGRIVEFFRAGELEAIHNTYAGSYECVWRGLKRQISRGVVPISKIVI